MIGRNLLHMHSLKSCHLANNNMKSLRCRYVVNLISSILRKLNINSVITVPNKRASISITLVTFRHERVKKVNPSSANLTKWSNKLKQFVGCCGQIV